MNTTKRNGEIELFRFVFSVIIVFYHFGLTCERNFFEGGYLGVEFFFLVSGYFLASHAYANRKDDWESTVSDTWRYLLSKIKALYPYFICAMILNAVVRLLIVNHYGAFGMVKEFGTSLPSLSLVFMGAGYDNAGFYVGNSWFISSMLLAMLVLYPLLLRFYHASTGILFPVTSVVLLGFMSVKYGKFDTFYTWTGMFYLGTLRAFAEIALGASLFELVRSLKRGNTCFSVFGKLLLSCIKYGSYLAVVAFIMFVDTGNTELHAIMFTALGIVLTMSGYCYSIPNCAFIRFLGKISVPIFIFHGFMRLTVRDMLNGSVLSMKNYVLVCVGALVLSVLLMFFTDHAARLVKAAARKIFLKKAPETNNE